MLYWYLCVHTLKFSSLHQLTHLCSFNYTTRPISGGTVDPALGAIGATQATKGSMFDPAKGSGVGLGEYTQYIRSVVINADHWLLTVML